MNDETKAALRRFAEYCRKFSHGEARVYERNAEDIEAALAHIDGEPLRQAKALEAVRDENTRLLRELENDAARLAAAREEQREALGLSRWPVLVPFIAAMVRKLDANKPKKGGREGWQNDDPQALLARVREEVDELAHAVAVSPRVDILHEAADVANMAMMVADSEGAIRATPLDATPLADELRTLRARVAELEAQLGGMTEQWKAELNHANAWMRKHQAAEAQVAAARAECERLIDRPWSRWAGDAGRDVLRAMDEATKK